MGLRAGGMAIAAIGLGFGAPAAYGFDWPPRKAGMWTVETPGNDGLSIKMCLDAATDREMMEAGTALGKSMCPGQTVAKEGEMIVITSTCEIAGIKVASRTEIAGDFQSEYTLTVKGDVTGESGAATPTNFVQKARWVSETCSDGLEPGDMMMPGGTKMNMSKLKGMLKSLGDDK